MKAPTSSFYESDDGLQLHYRDYSADSDAIPIICIPGLTRNSRDFEELAPHLAHRHRILTLDLRGRGLSAYDPEWRNYHPVTYANDVWRLLDTLDIDKVIIIGTSLGGLIAMLMASQSSQRLAGVVMNDIGPEIAPDGLARILQYTGRVPMVESWQQAADQTREIYGQWLPGLTDAEWMVMAKRAYRQNAEGVPMLDMDPHVGTAIREVGPQIGDPWDLFDGLAAIPTLLLRGANSDILSTEIVEKMTARKSDLEVVLIPDRGHVPLLNEAVSVAAIDKFLRGL